MSLTEERPELLELGAPPGPECSARVIQRSLETLRSHLGMEVGFIGRFESGCRVFEYVDASALDCPVRLGDREPLGDTYCGRIAQGVVPGLIPDARLEPGVADLEVTRRLRIGSYISEPLRRANGELLGTICCFSHAPDPTLRDRDLGLVRLFADLVSMHMEALLAEENQVNDVRRRVRAVIGGGGPSIAVQPIVKLSDGAVVGYEALSRFESEATAWTPQQWYDEASRAGVGPLLEASALGNALSLLPLFPEQVTLAVNASAEALADRAVLDLLTAAASPRLTVEITEHVRVADYPALAAPLDCFREAGGRLAVDDAGSGYAGLHHILQLRPDVVKLDRCLVSGLDEDPARRAMVTAMVGFALHTGADLVAEGVETSGEADALARLGVPFAQGYHFGLPSTGPIS